jgi:hypothetical protein
MNLGYDKNVFVRFTTDEWKSYYDRPAKFQEAPDNIYDIFLFEIEIPTNNDKVTFHAAPRGFIPFGLYISVVSHPPAVLGGGEVNSIEI